MNQSVKQTALWVGVVVALAAAAWFFVSGGVKPAPKFSDAQLSAFAQCLKTNGAVFYGAYWCPHCQNEKALFGGAANDLPYVECSPPSGNGQTQACKDKNISGYPTWEFKDGSRLSGEVALETLAEKTGCDQLTHDIVP